MKEANMGVGHLILRSVTQLLSLSELAVLYCQSSRQNWMFLVMFYECRKNIKFSELHIQYTWSLEIMDISKTAETVSLDTGTFL